MINILRQYTPESLKKVYRNLYQRLPVENSFGKEYWEIIRYIKKNQFLPINDIENLQFKQIKKIINYAFEYVPGYYQIYSEAGLSSKDLNKIEDLKLFPIVHKETIRDNLRDFTSKKLSIFDREYTATGGSSGIPFGFYRGKINNYSEPAYIHNGWERSGWKINEKSVVLRGQFIGSKNDFYYFNPKTKELALSSYYLDQSTYSNYKNKILSGNYKYIQAYASAISIFADLIIDNNDCGKIPFQIIFLGSENIYDFQIKKIKKAFPYSKINSWYGHSEQAILAQICEYTNLYHIEPTYGYAEIIDKNLNEVGENQKGNLVGTSFWNYATPFIRYKTDDIAIKGPLGCNKCGRNFQLIKSIEGRKQEIIVSHLGRHISMTAINMHTDIFKNIKQFQFYQDTIGKVELNLIVKDEFNEKDRTKIFNSIKEKLGDDIDLKLNKVASIDVTKEGKFRFLVQKLKLKYGD